MSAGQTSIWKKELLMEAFLNSFAKLNPKILWRNPIMFVVEIGSVMTTVVTVFDVFAKSSDFWFHFQITIWLWLTVVF